MPPLATLHSQKMQVACQMVHWIQQALIERSMDVEARVNKNKRGSADHTKGHDEISHDQETVSGEVHEERGDEEVHEAREMSWYASSASSAHPRPSPTISDSIRLHSGVTPIHTA